MRFTLGFVCAALLTLGSRTYGSPTGAFVVTITIDPTPAVVGTASTFTAQATGGSGGLTYQWDFGDGNVTAFDAANDVITHTYTEGAHLTVRVNVEDSLMATTTSTKTLTVHFPLPAAKPTNSSTIILDAANNRVWCVNADQDTVSAINATTHALELEKSVGKNPRTLAQAANGQIWVVSQQHPSISVLDPVSGDLLHVIPLPHGSLPYGIAMTPDGNAAYVTFQGIGGVALFSTATRGMLAQSTVPPSARGVSVASDGRVYVTRFISPQSDPLLGFNSAQFIADNHGEVVEFNSALGVLRTIKLVMDPGPGGVDPDFGGLTPPSTDSSRGVPNYVTSMVISPDGRRAWVPSKKDNVQRGKRTPERDGNTPSAETTYRAIVSSLDLTSTSKTVDEIGERLDIDNAEMPQAACMSPLGDYLFVALQGNNRVQVRDAFDPTVLINGLGNNTGTTSISNDGLAPQGLVIDPVSKKLFVHNYMGRTVTVFDATPVLNSNGAPASLGAPLIIRGTVTGGDAADLLRDPLNPTKDALRGKRVFYNAEDPRMSRFGYVSCAGCHLDGGADMRVFDFTNRGEGFRNTVMLQGRGGTAHGNVHWSANFNEIQDFDNDVHKAFHDGPPTFGALPVPPSFTGDPGSPNAPLGANNAARNDDLDGIAAYVASLDKVSRSPFRKVDGALTALGAQGEGIFRTRDCQKCHKGRNFTDSTVGTVLAPDPFLPLPGQIVLHDVGTIKPTSGTRLGGGPGSLVGIDTPTLKGLWQTAPYLHDGSAATLAAVMAGDNALGDHFGLPALTAAEQAALVQYMIEIDEVDAPPVPNAQVNSLALNSVATGRPYSLATATVGSLAFVDRSYRLATLPAPLGGKVLLRTAENDKNSGSGALVTFTLESAATVYVFIDNRAGTNKPAWMDAAWGAAPLQNLFLSHKPAPLANELSMLAYSQTFAGPFPQTVTLGGNQHGGPTGALRNFFVIIDQVAAVFEEGPLSRFEFVNDRDQDGDGLHDEYEAVSLLSPWLVNTGGVGTIPDEDKTTAGGATRFDDQTAFEFVPPIGGGSGGGGCGFSGLEPFVLLGLAALLRRRSR
jgi:DNA-binding beta-propeller fold protein YncE